MQSTPNPSFPSSSDLLLTPPPSFHHYHPPGKSFSDIDWRRNSIYTAFGFLYLGGAQYFIYVHGFKKIFNPAVVDKFGNQTIRQKLTNLPGLKSLFGQTFVDIGLHQPFMYLPAFYVVKEFMQAVNDVGTGEKGEYGSAKTLTDVSPVEIGKWRMQMGQKTLKFPTDPATNTTTFPLTRSHQRPEQVPPKRGPGQHRHVQLLGPLQHDSLLHAHPPPDACHPLHGPHLDDLPLRLQVRLRKHRVHRGRDRWIAGQGRQDGRSHQHEREP